MKKMLRIITLATVTFGCGYAFADSITKPNTFAPGSPIKSSEVNANFDALYTQVNKFGGIINTDATNKRIGIGAVSPQSVLEIFPTTVPGGAAINSFPVSQQTGLGGTVAYRLLMAHGEPGIQLSSDLNISSGQTGTETSLLGLQIGATRPIVNSVEQSTALYNQLFYGGSPFIIVQATPNAPGYPSERFRIDTSGKIGIGITPTYPLHMASGAYVTTGGAWTNASSREYKDNINALSLDIARVTLDQLTPVTYNYKKEPDTQHVGFIAEDVPDLVATKDRKGLSPMDIIAVVTKVVKDQQETIKNQDETIKAQGAAIQKQEKEIQALTTMLQQTLASMSAIQHKVSLIEAAQKPPMLQKASYSEMVH
ncbi:MAG: tail fiber domain-containing protein [Magnetococcales bacterium]|nr:tail fiber domain-containing protein [Magnetococcales bacterium]